MIFEKPGMLWLLLLIIIPVIFLFSKLKKLKKSPSFLYKTKEDTKKSLDKLQGRLVLRTLCFILAWICLVIASARPFWGKEMVQMQKQGNSVSFVFDISWSMTAKDVAQPEYSDYEDEFAGTRLRAAGEYAKSLLLPNKADDMLAVSVILAKGDGISVVPVTEDHEAVFTAIDALSPRLMSSSGSNIGAGIEKAISSFPSSQARQGSIILFTDGEETVESLKPAISNALKHGIRVFIIGFGSTNGVRIRTGDPKDKGPSNFVVSSLKEKQLENLVHDIKRSPSLQEIPVYYYNGSSEEGRREVLRKLYPSGDEHKVVTQLGYEIKDVKRHNLFIFLGIIFFILGVFLSYGKFGKLSINALMVMLLFNSCSFDFENSFYLLQGNIYWQQKNYQMAEMKFLKALNGAEESGNEEIKEYAVYGLGASYVMQNEEDAALERLESISQNAPADLKFASAYNIGVLSYSLGNYEKAAKFFKKALNENSESIDAKINLELSLRQTLKDVQEGAQTISQAGKSKKDSVVKDAVFSIIRENEEKKWKNQETKENSQSSTDY